MAKELKESRIEMPKSPPEPKKAKSLEDQLIEQTEGMDPAETVKEVFPEWNPESQPEKESNPGEESGVPLPKIAAQANLELPAIVPQFPEVPVTVSWVNPSDIAERKQQALFTPAYQNDPINVDPVQLHEDRVKKFGSDYVVVSKGKLQQVFTKLAWNSIRGSKFGWVEAVPVPPEVRNLSH